MLPAWVEREPLPLPGPRGPIVEGGRSRNTFARTFGTSLNPGAYLERPLPTGPRATRGHRPLHQRPPGSPSAARAPPAMIPAEWGFCRSIVVIVRGLPPWITTWDVRENFVQYGNIVYIELDDQRGANLRTARLRFEPPPTDISFFREGRCRVVIDNRELWPSIEFTRQSADDATFTTPLGNPCPITIVLSPPNLTFGVLTQPTTILARETVQCLGPEMPLKLTVDFRRKRLAINFPVRYIGSDPNLKFPNRYHRIDVKFGAIKNIHRVEVKEKLAALVIDLEDPPLIWRKRLDVKKTFQDDRVWSENDLWQRAVDIARDPLAAGKSPVALDDDSQKIDLGRWLTYWIELDEPTASLWAGVEADLLDWNIKAKTTAFSKPKQGTKSPLWVMLDDDPSAAPGTWGEDLALLGAGGSHTALPFQVRYQLEVCISRGIINEYNIERKFIEKLIELSSPDRLDNERGRLVLEYAADQGKRIYNPMELFSNTSAMMYFPTTLDIPDYCALIRKVTITPTRIYFNTPTVETTNRVIRHFKHVKDNFIRVQFTDELLEGRINGCEVDRDDQVYARAYRVLNNGIRMGPWHWKFLAYGNSQIRENGAFFFCEPETSTHGDMVTCDKIMNWMGRFNHITVVAKYAARIGQCFSTTRPVPGISAPRIVKIPDVKSGRHCFTDGVGKIASLLAGLVAGDWQIDPPSSAYQFRMGGCKGVLVTWPDVRGTEVHIRKSQEKFFAEFNGLEVIRCSNFSSATLNRQTITILSCLGVPDWVFVEMMADQLSSYDAAMTDSMKAVTLLSRFVDENQMTLTIAQMLLDGFMEAHEPFVQTVLQLWRSWSIKSLKEKARLTVDQGAFVLGCVDETKTLQGHFRANEGKKDISIDKLPQIFLQVPDPDDRGVYKVITGLCLVGRNPSLHPGDVRVVNAVDVPALRHIRDVVVFPLKGDRDIPSMCSGGDLDGDDFFVIWDQNLIPPEWCHSPMDYTPPPPMQESNGPTAESLKAFFVLYMKNNTLPLIAHAHLATADYEDDSVKNGKCLRLAVLHSMAVDYVKTGVPAEWSKKLEPRKWPHFMEKARKNSYHSGKALGQLYDMVKKETFDSRDNYKLPFDDRILSKYNLSNYMLKKARQLKTRYDIAMRRIMGQLEINTEFEVWTTFVISKPRVGTAYKLQEKVGRESVALKQMYRELCINEAGGSRDYEDLAPFVAAMYRVTSEEMRIALHEARQPHIRPDGSIGKRKITARSMPLNSFPWLFETVLGKIARDGKPAQTKLSDFVQLSIPKKPHGHVQSILDEQPEEMEMDYARTNDGQVIHRGEVLHLFRHEDDDEEDGLNLDEDVVPNSPVRKMDSEDSRTTEDRDQVLGEEGNDHWSLDSRMMTKSADVLNSTVADDIVGHELITSAGEGALDETAVPKQTVVFHEEEAQNDFDLIDFGPPSPTKKTIQTRADNKPRYESPERFLADVPVLGSADDPSVDDQKVYEVPPKSPKLRLKSFDDLMDIAAGFLGLDSASTLEQQQPPISAAVSYSDAVTTLTAQGDLPPSVVDGNETPPPAPASGKNLISWLNDTSQAPPTAVLMPRPAEAEKPEDAANCSSDTSSSAKVNNSEDLASSSEEPEYEEVSLGIEEETALERAAAKF
ncbi:RNA dependent RNA polymerase-domain-containing protein [Apodospora peruviana]|uniref:RNA dependent RNA polymerase-domain-containing protein n=1 Tax=Apodospora peruviana TaxID=516989 RepID=A0AAE0MG51_9PEZI|nr:RNA dependent RNA polymerase-domain-containing protein [Apodospora peruviana]